MPAYFQTEIDGVTFRWHGGEYIETGYVATERGSYERDYSHAVGDFVAQDCINVWDHERSAPTIERSLDAFEARCQAEIASDCAAAYELGADAARAAASWVLDGNATAEHYRALLALIEDGDPSADDHLPAMPGLSGEWADSPTPATLADELGLDEVSAEQIDAWETGVFETFQPECARLLRNAID